jgi:sporulation protein YlmC with PRC-barrel domain
MKKSSLFVATALAAALGAGSVLAQTGSTSNSSTNSPAASSSTTAPGGTSGSSASGTNATGSNTTVGQSATSSSTTASNASGSGAQFWTQDTSNEWRTSKLKGLNVYNNNNDKLGDIDDILVDQSGQIKAVVIGVGGFLGMGEHMVAVPFNQLQFVNTPRSAAGANNNNAAGANNTAANNNAARTNAGSPTTATTGNAALGSAGTTGANNGNANSATSTGTAGGSTLANNNNANNTRAGADRNNGPDHAVLNATKDQLKSAPEFKYRG